MSGEYKSSKDVPDSALISRTLELADAVTTGSKNEFTMRVPVECDRDADLVLCEIANRYQQAASQIADLTRQNYELMAQVEYFKNGMAELQDYIDKTEPENVAIKALVDELSTTIQLQRTALDSVLNRCDISSIPEDERKWLFSLTDPEPAQCLAEVKAQAVEDAIQYADDNAKSESHWIKLY